MWSKMIVCLIIPVILVFTVQAQEYGQTEFQPEGLASPSTTDLAKRGNALDWNLPDDNYNLSALYRSLDDWELIYSDTMSVVIPADNYFGISFDPTTETTNYIDFTEEMTPAEIQAIQRAPAWLRFDLYDNLRRFDYPIIAEWVADIINNAEDPYVDEVCFEAAHISPQLLSGPMDLQLLTENAECIYNVDDSLHFVQIVDYGTSADDDYYSTAVYRVIDDNGDTLEIEIDKEIYYWYVVHPKLSDELPAYIDPNTGFNTSPPDGVFWRSWFWTYADSGYAYYNEQWSDCEFLWDRTNTTTDAIDVVNSWIDNVMNWGAGSERPIQPVRIYALHCGNCGEYQDIRAAAGRLALIPTACTSNICEDHVWNEFWEREWIHWDGGDINNPLLYENGWGKVLSAVFNWRGDGYVWTVTDRYSADICSLYVSVKDADDFPADGYRVKVYSDFYYGGTYYTTWGVTDENGMCSFALGDSKNYYLRLEGGLGNYPASPTGIVTVIQNSLPDEVYTYSYSFDSTKAVAWAPQQDYPNPLDEYRMEITYNVQFESIYGNFFTYASLVPVQFTQHSEDAWIDFAMVNQTNFAHFDTTGEVEGFNLVEGSNSGTIDFTLPTDETWYGLFLDRRALSSAPNVFLNIDVYRNTLSVSDLPDQNSPLTFALNEPYPNPFNNETTISFTLPQNEYVELQVFNVSGGLVSTLAERTYPAGEHHLSWRSNATDASGIYLLKLNAANRQFSQKLVLLK